jgi:hypothetical protein
MNNSQINGLLKIAQIMSECDIRLCQAKGFHNDEEDSLALDLGGVHSGDDLDKAIEFTFKGLR